MIDALTGLCGDLANWDFDHRAEKHYGAFTITGGALDVDFLKPGQYFRVQLSLFNDRVWKYGEDVLTDETFDGVIWAMWVPLEILSLVDEIDRFNAKVDEMTLVASGYAQESFGGYMYTLSGEAPASMKMWESRIKSAMARWRKIR